MSKKNKNTNVDAPKSFLGLKIFLASMVVVFGALLVYKVVSLVECINEIRECESYIEKAEEYASEGDYEKAIKLLEDAYEEIESADIKAALKDIKKQKEATEGKESEEKNKEEEAFRLDDDENSEEKNDESGIDEPAEETASLNPMNMYMEFLEGNRGAYAVGTGTDSLAGYADANNMVYMTDILEMLKSEYLDLTGWDDKLSYIQYSYIDCGKDGVQELAVRFVGLDYYSGDDDSSMTYVLRCENGELDICYSGVSYARGMENLYYYGLTDYMGSSGAGSVYGNYSLISQDGEYQEVYGISSKYGMWTGEINYDAYEECFDYDQENDDLCISTYYIGDGFYKTYEIDYDCEEDCLKFIGLLEESGMEFCSIDEIEKLIADNMQKNGMKEECLEKKELTWQILDESLYSEYVGD